jgi:hypothetical protein
LIAPTGYYRFAEAAFDEAVASAMGGGSIVLVLWRT